MIHVIYRSLFLFAICAYGFCMYNISTLIDCVESCTNRICLNACNNFIGEIDYYPQMDEDAIANTSFQCTTADFMIINFNPGMYIIESHARDYNWNSTQVVNGMSATIENLAAGTDYQFSLYKLTRQGVSRPETSDWFSTYEVDYEPLPVKNISLVKLEVDKANMCQLRAEIFIEPAEDRSCSYSLINWDGEERLRHLYLIKLRKFRFELNELNFGKRNNITISSYNQRGEKFSPQKFIIINTPTCLEYYDNLSICAPGMIEGLQAKTIYRDKGVYDILVKWDEPARKPDNYTVEISFPKEERNAVVETVSGNKTEVFFFNTELESQYIVSIAAESLGGLGPVTEIIRNVNNDIIDTNKLYYVVIIGVTTLIIIAMLIGMIYLQHYKHKGKRFSMECSRFESLNEKDQPIKITMKLLHKDYETEIGNNQLLHDKFELCPQLLKFNGILGSGAYGVVKLGSLQDELGNVTDVAVKMLKENPSTEDLQNFHKEIFIMKFAGQHPNIVSLIGYCTVHSQPMLVVEYCCKGDLQIYLRTIWQSMVSVAFNHKARFNFDADLFTSSGIEYLSNNSGGKEESYQNIHITANRLYDIQEDLTQCTETVTATDLLSFARQITIGMEFLSSNRIIHRDLAARNVLVCADRIVKISDFGLSRDIYQENLYKKQGNGKLPLKWMAIEALTHQIYTTHSDVWSFGILLWEIVTMGATPYPGIPTNMILKLLKSGYRMERPPSCGVELYNIMYSCWQVRPKDRPTFTQLKENLNELLSSQSDHKYLNMDEILYDDQNHYRVFNE